MKYMMLIYGAEGAINDEQRQHCYKESLGVIDEIRAKGQFVAAAPLHSVKTATSVCVRDGRRLVTDGPFAETKEQLGGFYLVDAPNLDEAIAIAARIPAARWGTVEVRPVVELPGLPAMG
jgi:hypothetical protein